MKTILHSISYERQVMEKEYFAMSTQKRTGRWAFCSESAVEEMGSGYPATKFIWINATLHSRLIN